MNLKLKLIGKTLFFFFLIFLAANHLQIVKQVQAEIRKEVSIHILKNNFSGYETVVFAEHEIKEAAEWENTREFFLSGHLYDIFKVTSKNGIKYYHCIKDQKETVLKKYLSFFQVKKTQLEKKNEGITKIQRSHFILNQILEVNLNFPFRIQTLFLFKQHYGYTYFLKKSLPPEWC